MIELDGKEQPRHRVTPASVSPRLHQTVARLRSHDSRIDSLVFHLPRSSQFQRHSPFDGDRGATAIVMVWNNVLAAPPRALAWISVAGAVVAVGYHPSNKPPQAIN